MTGPVLLLRRTTPKHELQAQCIAQRALRHGTQVFCESGQEKRKIARRASLSLLKRLHWASELYFSSVLPAGSKGPLMKRLFFAFIASLAMLVDARTPARADD